MEIPTGSGIYVIRCLTSGKVYVGQASNLRVRWARHWNDLAAGRHHCKPLLRSWIKYGREAFAFEVLELVEPPLLTEREDHYIKALDASAREHGFNLAPAAGSLLGIKHGPYSKERVDKATAARTYRRGRQPSEEARAKMSAAHVGMKHTEETRAKCGAANKGRKLSAETRARIGEASQGHTVSPEAREKISAANSGKVRSAEARDKNAAAKRAMWADPEFHARMCAMRRGKKKSPEAVAETLETGEQQSVPRSPTESQGLLFS